MHTPHSRKVAWPCLTGLLLLALLLIGTGPAGAQITLRGQITDAATGEPMPDANLAIKNTLQGTTADDEGNFTLQVKSLPVTLIISYIGYQTFEVVVSEDATVKVALVEISLEAEDMVVVGSRFVPRTAITSPVPIDNIKSDALVSTGQLTFDKMLTYAVPAFNSTQQVISDATAHFDPADLRGLGPSRTLVLVNGKRKNPSSLVYINDTPGKGEVGVDMKSIPTAAIERIEVLRDGASAQYGSDAIAGVINIVLKDDPQGTDVQFFTGVMDEGDGDFRGYSLNTGLKLGGSGFLNVTHTFTDQDKTNRAGNPCGGDVDLDTCDGLFGGLIGLVDTDEERAWLRENPDLSMLVGLPNTTSSDIFYNSKLSLQGNAELYSFGGLQYRRGVSYALHRVPYWVDDPHNFYHEPGEPYDGFHPTFDSDIFDNSLTVGTRGQKRGWDFDISNTYGKNKVDYTVRRSLNTDMGAESPTTFRVGGYEFSNNVTDLNVARRLYNATLSLGSEFRTENFVAKAGEEASYFGSGTQSFPGLQPQNEIDAFRYNIGIYSDIALDLNEDLLVGGAARFENYSDFGDNFTWKINGRYKLMEDKVSMRASSSTGFRAPSLHQIYLSNIQTLVSGGTVSNQGTFNNESTVLRALKVPQLKDEDAFNITAGVALQPMPALFLSLDVYQVDVDDRILYSSSIASDDQSTVVGQILDQYSITSLKFFINAVNTRTRGIDFVANYSLILGGGDLDVSLAANFNDTEIEGKVKTPAPIAAAGVDIFDRKEQSRILSARPEDKISLGLTYERGDLTASLNNTRFGAVTWQHATDPAMDQTFASKVITDLNLHYQYSEVLGIGLGANNLLNVYPDKIDNKGDVLTNLGGRFQYPWEVNQFGSNGIVTSAKVNLSF